MWVIMPQWSGVGGRGSVSPFSMNNWTEINWKCDVCMLMVIGVSDMCMSWWMQSESTDVTNSLATCPDPISREEKGLAISWLCWVNSLDFGQANEMVPHHPSMRISQRNRPYISCKHVINVGSKSILLTRHNQEITALWPDPFPCEGHKTTISPTRDAAAT